MLEKTNTKMEVCVCRYDVSKAAMHALTIKLAFDDTQRPLESRATLVQRERERERLPQSPKRERDS